MTERPVTAADIADLLSDLRALSYPATPDPATRAQVLARKADLLTRIASQHGTKGPRETP
jgi:hypothetical protein